MTAYVKPKYVRKLDGKNIRINKVFNAYRSGGLEIGGKWVGKSFVYFPKRITDDVIASGDERAKYAPGDELAMELREKSYNREAGRFEFTRVKEKLDGEFFKTYKKVFDVEVTLGETVSIPTWDKVAKQEVNSEFGIGETLMLQEFSAGKLKTLLEDLELDSHVELVDGKDKMGNAAKVKPYDWEDNLRKELEGRFVVIRVKGEGMDTKYKFKDGVPFEVPEEKKDGGINIMDIPF